MNNEPRFCVLQRDQRSPKCPGLTKEEYLASNWLELPSCTSKQLRARFVWLKSQQKSFCRDIWGKKSRWFCLLHWDSIAQKCQKDGKSFDIPSSLKLTCLHIYYHDFSSKFSVWIFFTSGGLPNWNDSSYSLHRNPKSAQKSGLFSILNDFVSRSKLFENDNLGCLQLTLNQLVFTCRSKLLPWVGVVKARNTRKWNVFWHLSVFEPIFLPNYWYDFVLQCLNLNIFYCSRTFGF